MHRNHTEQVPNKFYGALLTDNPNIERLIIAVADQQVSVTQMMERLSLKHRSTSLDNYLNPAMDEGLIRTLLITNDMFSQPHKIAKNGRKWGRTQIDCFRKTKNQQLEIFVSC